MLRLDKYLADLKVGTRAEVKKYIRAGRVEIDGQVCKKPETKVNPEENTVLFDSKELCYKHFEYFMLNKPAGVISATEDSKEETVLDLITTASRKDLFPVGRLDKDTEGLLLITNDGALAHRLLSPKKHVDKVYYAKVAGVVTKEDQEAFQAGLNIGSEEEVEMTRPANLKIINSGSISEIELTIHEGKFHQVKRMFLAVGKEVIYLKRLSMGSLHLDGGLAPGEYRELTESEIKSL